MLKISSNSMLCALIMLGNTIEIKPIFRFITLQSLKKASITSPYIALAGITAYIGIPIVQLKRLFKLHDRCLKSDNNTQQGWKEFDKNLFSLQDSRRGPFFNKVLIQCMKNKNENLQNYYYCQNRIDQLSEKR
jgi:hypothetical protein